MADESVANLSKLPPFLLIASRFLDTLECKKILGRNSVRLTEIDVRM